MEEDEKGVGIGLCVSSEVLTGCSSWWERLALIYMNHLDGDQEENRRKALQTVTEGLDDPMTHTSKLLYIEL